jgi:iron complex outermembrane receptor protein
MEEMAAPDRLDQILDQLPNVQLGNGGQGPTIRGQDSTGVLQDLPAFLGGTRPRVTLQVDGRAVAYNEFVFGVAPLWDISQVEVFRSPQTTTLGRNSIAGAIIIATADPSLEWETKWRAIHGSASTWQGSAVISGPLLGEQLAFRAAADFRRSRASSDIGDNMRGADPDRDRYGMLRFKVLAHPDALPGTKFTAIYAHTESRAPQVERIAVPFPAREDPSADYGIWGTNVDSLTLRVDQSIRSNLELKTTFSQGHIDNQRFAPPGRGEARNRARDTSFETLLTWHQNEKLSAHVGLHLLRTQLDQTIDLTSLGLGIGTFFDRQASAGLFAETAWKPFAFLTLTAGVRRQHDEQEREGLLTATRGPISMDYDESFSNWLPKVSVNYAPSQDLTLGAMVQRATNPGGVTLVTATGEHDRFEEETLWNFEAFLRGNISGGTLRFAANAFYNAMTNAQRARLEVQETPTGEATVTRFGNVPKAHSYGFEGDLRWIASSYISLRAAVGLLRTRIDRTVVLSDPLRGKEFGRAPHLSASTSVEWRPTAQLRLSAQARYHSSYFSDDANNPARKISRGAIVDVRATFTQGRVILFGYARNLLDRFQLTYLYNPLFATAVDPREAGIGLETRF